MRNQRDRGNVGVMILSSGMTLNLVEFESHIAHVRLSWERYLESSGLLHGEEALITSVLVVPPRGGLLGADQELGELAFSYNGGQVCFRAPVVALANRYHGLATAAALLQRVRLMGDPMAGYDDWLDSCVFSGVLHEAMLIREGLAFDLRHHAPVVGPDGPYRSAPPGEQDFTVEIQALIKRRRGVSGAKPFFNMTPGT